MTDDLVANRQRKGAAADPEAVESLEEVIALLLAQRRHLEGEIASLIDDDPLWACLDRAFRQIKGVAERSVARLLAEVPEIGSFSNRAVSKLVGLAPLADDSGQRSGRPLDPRRPCRTPQRSSSSSPASSPNTTRTSPPSSTGCRPPERPKWSSASPSPANSSSSSTQKHATRETNIAAAT